MNNERAIELLHRLQDEQFDGIHGDERREALEMAVKALSGDGDTISRQQAIDAVVSAMIDGADAELVEGVMELLPSAQPHWVPCSERLPEKKQSLLVTVADEVIPYTSDDEWTGTGFWAYGKRVSAWMPLPKPYRGESE